MKTLGFLNPKAGSGQSRLIFNLGSVLADAGFRVGLVDFDPQTSLTERAGRAREAAGSVYDALTPADLARSEPRAPDPVQLASNLWLVCGHILASTFDDALATAWTPSVDPRAQALARGIGRMIETFVDQHELDVVLCDLGPSLGAYNHALCEAVDALVVPVAPRAIESAALLAMRSTLQRWRSEPYPMLGFVTVRPSGVTEIGLDQVAAAYHRELSGEHLGTIKEFPSLASMARMAHKPEIELTMADGATGSLSSAVADLRRQYETLATTIVRVSGIVDDDVLIARLEHVLYLELQTLPPALEHSSSRTVVDQVSDIEVETMEVRPGGLRVTGSGSVTVTLERGGGESRDGVEVGDHLPLRFDLELDRSHESVAVVHRLEVDPSSFFE